MKKNLDPRTTNRVIDCLGGTYAVARICDISPASVSEWRRNGMPDARCQFFQIRNPEAFPAKPARKRARQA